MQKKIAIILILVSIFFIPKIEAKELKFSQDMGAWETTHSDRFDISYSDSISTVKNTAGGWYEHLYKPLNLAKGTYKVTFDYKVLNDYELLNNYPGVTIDILLSKPTQSSHHNKNNVKATLSKTKMSDYETITFEFNITQDREVYLDLDWGEIKDNTITNISFKNFKLTTEDGSILRTPTSFPNWSNQYEDFNSSLVQAGAKENLDYFIKKLDSIFSHYIITSNTENGYFNVIVSANNKKFSLDKSNDRYTEDVYRLGNANSDITKYGVADLYDINVLNKKFVDEYIKVIKEHYKELSKGSLSNFWLNYDNVIPVYTSWSDTFEIKNFNEKITIFEEKYDADKIPTAFVKANEFIFDEKVNTEGLNKIIFTFDIPKDKNFSYDLDINLTMLDDYLPRIYLEQITEENTTIVDILNEGYDDCDEESYDCVDVYSISGFYGIDYFPLNELKLVIDVKEYNEDLYIYFKTNYSFTVEYITAEDEEAFWTTIAMHDIYGLYLMPKTLNIANFRPIYLNGKYDIEVYDITNSEKYKQLDKQTNYTFVSYQFLADFDKINTLFYFKNCDYALGKDNDYTITFDNRYFNYSIKEYAYSDVSIINPNTGEEILINEGAIAPKTIADYISSSRTILKSFNTFIKEYFNLVNYFFTSLNDTIRNVIIALVIIAITCAIIITSRK